MDTGSPEPPSSEANKTRAVRWNTTAGSVVHALLDQVARIGPHGVNPCVKFYVATVAVTLLPLLVGAVASPLPLFTPTPTHPLPFFYDANVLYMVLVSLPSLAFLSVSDQELLSTAIGTVKSDGTLTITEADERRLAERWRKLFRIINPVALCVAICVATVITYLNFRTYTEASIGFWIADQGQLLPVGYVFLYCIFALYTLIPIYIIRNIAISLLLKDIVEHAQIHLLPLHPDKAGGLRPMGRLGLRNQYALTIIGFNVVLFVIVSNALQRSGLLSGLIVAAIVAYLIFSPIIFLAPLLPFRAGMLESKGRMMSEIARRMRAELERLRAKPITDPITKEDEETVERLRKIGAVIDELPVWPFDAGTLRKFLTAYVIPIAGGTIIPALMAALEFLRITPPA